MRHFRLKLAVIAAPALTLALIAAGCGGNKDEGGGGGGGAKSGGDSGSGSSGSGSGSGEKKAIEAKARGTVKGKVTIAGNKPDIAGLNKTIKAAMEKHQNKDVCLAGSENEKSQQQWVIDEKGGIGNVVVYLKAPKGSYFKLTDDDIKSAKEVKIDQPHCAFIPHVVTLFPSYFDGKAQKTTGQKFIAKNSSSIGHNTKWQGGSKNRGDNKNIGPGQQIEIKLVPDDTPVNIGCDVHTWMTAFARVFDHPFVTVTNPDGTFEIKNVPLDVDVQVGAWHESGTYGEGGQDGQKKKLKDGDEINFTIAPK